MSLYNKSGYHYTFISVASTLIFSLVLVSMPGCFSTKGLIEVKKRPLPVISEDDSTLRMGDEKDRIFIEVRKAPSAGAHGNLAIRYEQLFPGGPAIRLKDRDRYLDLGDNVAYRVDFEPSYIRYRKRFPTSDENFKVPKGWSVRKLNPNGPDNSQKILVGPVTKRQTVLFLVEGNDYIYYVFGRADGSSISAMMKIIEDLVEEGIDYH